MFKQIHFILIISLLFGWPSNANAQVQDDTGKHRGLKIVLVVDASRSLKNHKDLVENVVSFVYDSIRRPEKDDVHLITFSDHERLIVSVHDKQSAISEINKEMEKISKSTIPAYGLRSVFDLVGKQFPEKVGILLLISDGENSGFKSTKTEQDLKRVIASLKSNGFTVFSIFLSTGTKYSNKPFMKQIAEWSGTKLYEIKKSRYAGNVLSALKKDVFETKYSSPVPIQKFVEIKKQWDENLQTQLIKAGKQWDEKFDTLKFQFELLFFSVIAVLIGGLVVFAVSKMIFSRKKPSKETSPKISSPKGLWGKLELRDETGKPVVIDLSDKAAGFLVKTPKDRFNFRLFPEYCDNQKVITVTSCNGCNIQYLTGQKNLCRNPYIDSETRFIRIIDPDNNEKYQDNAYHFLNKLSESYQQPVWKKNEFIGHDALINMIKENYLKKSKDFHHCILSGMGNSGKTSLMKYLHHVLFHEDKLLKERYTTALLEFKNEKNEKWAGVKNKMEKLFISNTKEKIVLIDEYDNFFDKFSDDFGIWLREHQGYFILAGRNVLKEKYAFQLFDNIRNIELTGIDHPKHLRLTDNLMEPLHSVRLIESILSHIGLNSNIFSKEVPRHIAWYASGIPYFIKRILYALLAEWINGERRSIKIDDVESAVLQIIEPEKLYTIIKACNEDERGSTGGESEDVRIRDILNALATMGKGRAEMAAVKSHVADHVNEAIKEAREKSFDDKLIRLKSLGFIIQDGEYLVGIPRLFYFQGEEALT